MIQGAVSPLIDAPATSSNNNIKLLLPGGLSCLSETLTQTLNQCESGRDVRDKLDRDIDVYIRSANSHWVTSQQAQHSSSGALSLSSVRLAPLDPQGGGLLLRSGCSLPRLGQSGLHGHER